MYSVTVELWQSRGSDFFKKKKIPEILYVRVQSIEHFCFVCFESCLKFHGRKSSWKPLNSLLIFKIKAFLCSVFASSRRCINILNAYALKLLPFLQQLTIYPVEWFGVAVEHISMQCRQLFQYTVNILLCSPSHCFLTLCKKLNVGNQTGLPFGSICGND